MKQTSQRSLLFRQNVNRTEAEWVHFLDGYRKALIEFDMKKFGDDWHTAEDIVEEIFLNIVREPRITALRPQDSFRHVLINMSMQKHKSFTKPWRKRLAERLSVALCLTMRTQDDARREIVAGFLDLVLADLADATRDGDWVRGGMGYGLRLEGMPDGGLKVRVRTPDDRPVRFSTFVSLFLDAFLTVPSSSCHCTLSGNDVIIPKNAVIIAEGTANSA